MEEEQIEEKLRRELIKNLKMYGHMTDKIALYEDDGMQGLLDAVKQEKAISLNAIEVPFANNLEYWRKAQELIAQGERIGIIYDLWRMLLPNSEVSIDKGLKEAVEAARTTSDKLVPLLLNEISQGHNLFKRNLACLIAKDRAKDS